MVGRADYLDLVHKKCKSCGETLPIAEFYKQPKMRDGYFGQCKKCHYKTGQEWRKRNREKINQQNRSRMASEVAKIRQRTACSRWRLANKDYDACRSRERKARERKAMPNWADRSAIRSLYRQCQLISSATGTPHHVDHIVPLTSEFVCGLHVHYNLQVIPQIENLRKRNLWWPGKDGWRGRQV